MRTDVKLGIVTSMVVVLAVGGYFLFHSDSQAPIPIADKASPTTPKTAAKPPAGKQPITNPARQVTTSKDAAGRTNLPVNRDPKVATKPADRPPVATTKEVPVYKAPVVEAKSDPQTAPPVTLPSPAERTSLAERSPDSMPTAPVTSPAGAAVPSAVPGSVPGAVTSREPEAGHASRTLMAGNEPAKSAPTTPADSAALTSPAPATPIVATKPQPSGAPSEVKPDLGKVAVDTHRVQPGDSLASLAQTYYGNAKYAKFLAESNPGISDPAKLALGATVKIPPLPQDVDTRMAKAAPAKAPAAAATGKKTYKVKSGDSFYKIAKEQLGNAERWKELLDLNKTLVHSDPTQLQPGQTLALPDS